MCPDCESKISFKKVIAVLAFIFVPFMAFNAYSSGGGDDHKNHGLKDTSKKELVNILKINEDLHDAFFNYDGKNVATAAMKLKSAIDKLNNPELVKLLKFSSSKLQEIKSTNTREDNNQKYHLVSIALIHLMDKYQTGSNYSSYTCPMVKKKWIQNTAKSNKVLNPYAANMPHCGSKI